MARRDSAGADGDRGYCMGCGAGEVLRHYRVLTEGGTALRCTRCGSIKIQSLHKRQDDETENYLGKASHEALLETLAYDFFRWVGTWHSLRGRALEVGCSVGTFVAVGQRLGLQVEGIDIDRRAVAFGVERGRPLRVGTIADCAGSYDLILCHHVFEHLSDPEDFLRRVRALLAPGGAFAAAMPYAGLEARLKGRRWIGWGPSAHHWLYSRAGVAALLRRSNLEVRRIDVRNGIEPYTFADHRSSPALMMRYIARRLVRGVADMVGSGCQAFVLAVRPAREQDPGPR